MKIRIGRKSLLLALFTQAAVMTGTAGNYAYETNSDGSITIVRYAGRDGAVTVPSVIDNRPVTAIGRASFAGRSDLTGVTIPQGVASIGIGAFSGCTSLASVTIPSSVTNIGDVAFRNCTSLTNVTIPAGVINIETEAFYLCHSLTTFKADALNPAYSSVDGVLFNKNRRTLVHCPGGRTGSYAIPAGVTDIGRQAFFGCTDLGSVTIPSSVTNIGIEAFYECSSLADMTIPSSVTEVGPQAFSHCSNLTNVVLPASVTSVGSGLFSHCPRLLSAPIPPNTTDIGPEAFHHCTNLTSVTIPPGVTCIGADAFSECYSLTNVTIPPSVTRIGNEAFYDCTNLTNLAIPSSVTNIGSKAFDHRKVPPKSRSSPAAMWTGIFLVVLGALVVGWMLGRATAGKGGKMTGFAKFTMLAAIAANLCILGFEVQMGGMLLFLFIHLMEFCSVLVLASLGYAAASWSERRWKALLPLGILAVGVVAVAPSLWIGAKVCDAIFWYNLPKYRQVVERVESGDLILNEGFRRLDLPRSQAPRCYCVLASKTPDGKTKVEFLIGQTFPVKHNGYMYYSGDTVEEGRRWPRTTKMTDHWWQIGD